jgi:hypothetical protein
MTDKILDMFFDTYFHIDQNDGSYAAHQPNRRTHNKEPRRKQRGILKTTLSAPQELIP